eukprot:jgi/Psemu1/313006/fgenesh1_kg.1075_\
MIPFSRTRAGIVIVIAIAFGRSSSVAAGGGGGGVTAADTVTIATDRIRLDRACLGPPFPFSNDGAREQRRFERHTPGSVLVPVSANDPLSRSPANRWLRCGCLGVLVTGMRPG